MTNISAIVNDIINKGYTLSSILTEISNYILHNTSISDKNKASLLFEFSDIEKKMTNYSKPMLDLEKKMFLQKMKEREDYINMMQSFKNKYTNAK